MQTLVNVTDVQGENWTLVYVFEDGIPLGVHHLMNNPGFRGQLLNWGGFENAIGFKTQEDLK